MPWRKLMYSDDPVTVPPHASTHDIGGADAIPGLASHASRHVSGGADEVLNLTNINNAVGFSVDAHAGRHDIGGADAISGLASHASRHVSGGADAIPAGGIARSQLEYPTVDVPLGYLFMIGKAFVDASYGGRYTFIVTVDSFADKQIAGAQLMKGAEAQWYEGFLGRCGADPRGNAYLARIDTGKTSADLVLEKIVNGTVSSLGSEAVDLSDDVAYIFGLSATGSTIKAVRYNRWSISAGAISWGTLTVAVTASDTSFSSGTWATRTTNVGGPGEISAGFHAFLRAPASLPPKALAYFEVPLIGSGTFDDPFRAKMPEEIVTDPVLGKRNLLALTHSALIPTDPATGKPIHGTAIVRIFEQPDRDIALHPISKCLDALRAMSGVRELKRKEAIALAKAMDDKLTDVDLIPIPSTHPNFKTILSDYIAHREALGVKRELIDDKLMERYLTEEKGW